MRVHGGVCSDLVAHAGAAELAGTPRFQILSRIGAGGMGIVYEALDRERNRRVALKTLRHLSADALLRFKHEFRALADLHHPNLVRLDEMFEHEGQWFFTMELVEGVDLLSWVCPRTAMAAADAPTPAPITAALVTHTLPPLGPPAPAVDEPRAPGPVFDPARLTSALLQLVEGLGALHASGQVHRDIKPSNVLVTRESRVVILDFGLVADADPRPLADPDLVGTVAYMAPEQAEGAPVGPEADWYSTGVVLYQALTGHLPFSGRAVDVLARKRTTEPQPPSAFADVPASLDGLCVELLRRDPRARPDRAELRRRLGAPPERDAAVGAAPRPEGTFVGRAAELAALRDALEAARDEARTILVCGESGVGKTALVQRFLTGEVDSAGRPLVLLQGRCYEREAVPFKAVDGVIDALTAYLGSLGRDEASSLVPRHAALLAQVFPVLMRVPAFARAERAEGIADPQERRALAFAALKELLNRLAHGHQVVIAIDDLQWADADGLALLAALLVPPGAPRLLLVGTVRTRSRDEALEGLLARIPVPTAVVRLGGLPQAEARELAHRLLGGANHDAAPAEFIASEADGHPLFVAELVRQVIAGGPGAATSMRLDDAIWLRVGALDRGARLTLEAIAVAGAAETRDTVAAAAGIDLGGLHGQIAELRGANLVRTTGTGRADRVDAYHDRVREAVVSRMAPDAVRAAHARLAAALERSATPDPEALALHWRAAGQASRAAPYTIEAAARAADALAFDRAAELYALALELIEPASAEGRSLRTKLADALASAGRGPESGAAYLAAAEGASPEVALDLQRRAAEQLLRSGHLDAGVRVVRTVLGAAGLRLPGTTASALASLVYERARLRLRGLGFHERAAPLVDPVDLMRIDVTWAMGLGLSLVNSFRGMGFQTLTLRLALEAGEPYRIARAAGLEAAFSAAAAGRPVARTVQLLEMARELADRTAHPHAQAFAELGNGMAAFLVGSFRQGFERCEHAVRICQERCTGVAWESASAQAFGMWSLYYLGDIAELRRRVPLLLKEALARGDLYHATNMRTSHCNQAWLLADEPAEARRQIKGAMEDWSPETYHLPHYYELHSSTQVDLYEGYGEQAWERIAAGIGALRRSLLLGLAIARFQVCDLRARAALAAATRSPHRTQLLRAAARDARRLAGSGAAWTAPLAALIRSRLCLCAGERGAAVALLRSAIDAFEASDMRLHAEAARWRLGETLGGTEGDSLVAGAGATLTACGVASPARAVAMLAPGAA